MWHISGFDVRQSSDKVKSSDRTLVGVQVQKAVAEGLTVLLLDRSDSSKAMARSIAREMLGSAVLRNVMFFFTPYTINKARQLPANDATVNTEE